MSNSCQDIKKELIECIHASKCFSEGKKFGECIRGDESEISSKCVELRTAFFACKRGQVSNLTNFSYKVFSSWI